MNPAIQNAVFKKATHSPSHIRMAGVAFSRKGEVLGIVSNGFRANNIVPARYSGEHVERKLIARYGNLISKIVLMRIGRGGAILPIDPCPKCQKLLDKYGIKVSTVRA